MLRWILQDHDHISVFRHYAVEEGVVHAQLSQMGFDQPFWFYVTDQAFRSFFNRDYLRPEDLQSEQLKIWQSEMQRVSIPHEMKNQIRKLILDEGMSGKKFTVRLSCDLIKGAMPNKLLYDYCEMTAFTVEGIFQAIKSSWVSLLNKGFMTSLWNSGLTLADLKVGILVMAHSESKVQGKVYSVSPKCLWDRRHLVLTMTKMLPAKDYIEAQTEVGEHAYLVDRETLTVTYYGRTIFGDKTKSRTSAPFDYELIKKVAKQFIQAEKVIGHPLIGEWSTTQDGRSYFNRWNQYSEVPSASFYQNSLNSPSRHFWNLMQWNKSGEMCLPFWFSLMVKHFRSGTLKMLTQTGAKKHMPASYERVLRQTLGLLRGRAYLNLGALHRLLALAPYDSMFSEVERALGNWQKRFDKELRVFWDGPWPDVPVIKPSEKKQIRSNYKKVLNSINKNTELFFMNFDTEMQSLYEIKWDQKNLSESFQEVRDIEARMSKLFSPALFVEFEYWSMKSYCHKVSANNGDFSWFEDEDKEFIPVDGNWMARRRQRLLNERWEKVKKSRKKVHQSLFKYFDLFKKRVEVLASKFVALGILKKASDVFYLNLDEILSFEEGRLMTINLQNLVQIRTEEYRTYAADEKTPQIWLTIGLVGLAEKYQSVISVKDSKQEWTPSFEDLIDTEDQLANLASALGEAVGNGAQVENGAQLENEQPLEQNKLVDQQDPLVLANTDVIATADLGSSSDLSTGSAVRGAENEEELLDLPSPDNFVENLLIAEAKKTAPLNEVNNGVDEAVDTRDLSASANNEEREDDIFKVIPIRNIEM